MVDSIRQPARIGSVIPSGPLRPLERRRQPRQESGSDRDDVPQGSGEENQDTASDPAGAAEACSPPSDEEALQEVKPGRCIDVRI